jgi:hypothetical protein
MEFNDDLTLDVEPKFNTEYVRIAPNGLFLVGTKGEKRIRKRVKKLECCAVLRHECRIAEGTTLRDLFEMVDSYNFLKLFISEYAWCRAIDEFHEEARLEPSPDEEPLEYVEVYWHPNIEHFQEKRKHPGGTRERIKSYDFSLNAGFHGVRPVITEDDKMGDRGDGKIHVSVSHCPVNQIAYVPLRLNEEFKIWDKPPSNDIILRSKRSYTLLEVLEAIYWDISFDGSPSQRDAFVEELRGMVDEIKSGRVAGIPMDQVNKQLGTDFPLEVGDGLRIILHPDAAKNLFGVDPDQIPLDDKEIIRPDGK